jgi:hypothetical protein
MHEIAPKVEAMPKSGWWLVVSDWLHRWRRKGGADRSVAQVPANH